jgi:hypothetical protein
LRQIWLKEGDETPYENHDEGEDEEDNPNQVYAKNCGQHFLSTS